jgi:hypothetical protein
MSSLADDTNPGTERAFLDGGARQPRRVDAGFDGSEAAVAGHDR